MSIENTGPGDVGNNYGTRSTNTPVQMSGAGVPREQYSGMSTAVLTAAQVQAVQSLVDGPALLVGEGGAYANLADAIDRVTGMSLSDDAWAHIVLLPGTHKLSVTGALPRYVAVSGYGMASVLKLDEGTTTLTPLLTTNQNNLLSNFRIRYAPSGSGVKYAIDNSGTTGQAAGTIVQLHQMWIEAEYTGGLVIGFNANGQRYYEILGSTIASSGYGLNITSANTVHAQGSNFWLLNSNTGQAHVGIRQNANGSRLQARDCKIATGYGPFAWPASGGIENESDQNIYGVLVTASLTNSSRTELYNCWSIVRNETGANAGVDTISLCSQGGGLVRVFGGYYQAEDGGSWLGDVWDISNESTGQMEIVGPCGADRVNGAVWRSSPSSIARTLTANRTLNTLEGGVFVLDSSGGNITITLPSSVNYVERTFKRTSASNTVTIQRGGTATINGATSYVIPAAAGAYVTIVGDGTNWHIIGHGSP